MKRDKKLREIFRGCVSTKVVVTSGKTATSHLLIATEDTIEDMTEKTVSDGLAAGHDIQRADGRREWIEPRMIVDCTKTGSDAFIWAKDGNRVKHERVHIIIDADGNRTETVVGTSYRQFE
tara:strand:+ start:168 stop:530 length:363 start_codon:yes stop_codon:yes gene_type:complete